MKKLIGLGWIIFLSLILTSCSVSTGLYGFWQPFDAIPARFQVDDQGHLSIEAVKEVSVPVFLGRVGVGVNASLRQELTKDRQGVLTIRHNGYEDLYDLKGQNLNISFEPGYYRIVKLEHNGLNWLLELERDENYIIYRLGPDSTPTVTPMRVTDCQNQRTTVIFENANRTVQPGEAFSVSVKFVNYSQCRSFPSRLFLDTHNDLGASEKLISVPGLVANDIQRKQLNFTAPQEEGEYHTVYVEDQTKAVYLITVKVKK